MPAGFFHRFQQAGSSGGSGRLDIWTVGLTAFKHYGLVGAGFSNFPFAYTNYAGEARNFQGSYRDPHNIYLRIGVELGLIGLVLFVLAVRSQFRAIPKSLQRSGVDTFVWRPVLLPGACLRSVCLEIFCGVRSFGLP